MALLKILGVFVVFIVGLSAGLYFADAQSQDWTGLPDGEYTDNLMDQVAVLNPFGQELEPKDSPKDRIPESAIKVWHDRVVIDVQNTQWATFTDTHSMEPVIMTGSNAIHIVPETEEDLQVGDICSYKSEFADGSIIHRIVYKGEDEEGAYFIFKGDNVPTSDPGRVRFSQVQRCVVAIIY